MSKLLSLSIDVSKITKDKLYKGKKGTYLKLTAAIADEKDAYGNDVSVWEEQTQEERKSKQNKKFLGNGKIFWDSPQQLDEDPNQGEEETEYDPPF